MSPVLSLLGDGFPVASCHLGPGAGLSRRSDLNGRVLERSRGHGHFIPTLSTKQSVFKMTALYKSFRNMMKQMSLSGPCTFRISSTTSV